jgi:hypothetical protein
MYATHGNLKPQETNGFKSKLEYIASKWLTEKCKLKVLYEPFTYKTLIGNYTPDFLCEETNQYFECKPTIDFAHTKLYLQFCREKNAELIVITPTQIYMHDFDFDCETYPKSEVFVIVCSKCNKVSFCESSGSYHCRKCKHHNGNHDVRKGYSIISFSNFYESFKNKYGRLVIE